MKRVLIGWLLVTAACWLVLGLLFASVIPGGLVTILAASVAASAPLLLLLRGFTRRSYPRRSIRLFVIRPFWYVQLLLPFVALAGLAGLVAGAAAGAFNASAHQWALAGGRGAVISVTTVALLFFLAGYLGSRRLVVRRFVASIPALPDAFEGMRIVQLTDLHVGPHTPRGKLARIAQATRDADPDLIALTGDLVDDYSRDVEPFAAGLGRLTAPLGVYAIAGNHDVYAGWTEVRRGLEAEGITVLVNDAVPLERRESRIALLGTGDPAGLHWSRGGGNAAAPDVRGAVAAARTMVGADGVLIALAHNPVLWPALARAGVDLTLSGHTHWGQMAIPGTGWSLASPFLRHAMGEYVEDGRVLYVHPGTNYWGLPFRMGTPPEVAVITLRRGEAAFALEG
ncbi:MAG: metallophosphoesterase [Gemmatimonadaceae bacterium]|nr:metallophosphoesterase [Gemmatimonadaceae bacterium]